MGTGLYLKQKSKLRNHFQKIEKENIIIKAEYLFDFNIRLWFSNGSPRVVNFLPLFSEYVKGENTKYFAPAHFKKFIVKNGNIYWGRNEDVIFPLQLLLHANKKADEREEVLYVI